MEEEGGAVSSGGASDSNRGTPLSSSPATPLRMLGSPPPGGAGSPSVLLGSPPSDGEWCGTPGGNKKRSTAFLVDLKGEDLASSPGGTAAAVLEEKEKAKRAADEKRQVRSQPASQPASYVLSMLGVTALDA